MAVRTLIGWTLSSREARTAYREVYDQAVLRIAAEFVPEGEQARALADRVMEKMFQRFAQQPLAEGHEDYLRAQAYLICMQAVHPPLDAEAGAQRGVSIASRCGANLRHRRANREIPMEPEDVPAPATLAADALPPVWPRAGVTVADNKAADTPSAAAYTLPPEWPGAGETVTGHAAAETPSVAYTLPPEWPGAGETARGFVAQSSPLSGSMPSAAWLAWAEGGEAPLGADANQPPVAPPAWLSGVKPSGTPPAVLRAESTFQVSPRATEVKQSTIVQQQAQAAPMADPHKQEVPTANLAAREVTKTRFAAANALAEALGLNDEYAWGEMPDERNASAASTVMPQKPERIPEQPPEPGLGSLSEPILGDGPIPATDPTHAPKYGYSPEPVPNPAYQPISGYSPEPMTRSVNESTNVYPPAPPAESAYQPTYGYSPEPATNPAYEPTYGNAGYSPEPLSDPAYEPTDGYAGYSPDPLSDPVYEPADGFAGYSPEPQSDLAYEPTDGYPPASLSGLADEPTDGNAAVPPPVTTKEGSRGLAQKPVPEAVHHAPRDQAGVASPGASVDTEEEIPLEPEDRHRVIRLVKLLNGILLTAFIGGFLYMLLKLAVVLKLF